jgi:hypothetical protein
MNQLTGDEQIEKLANFITDNSLGDPSQSEGAVDIAIQIIEAQHRYLVTLGETVRNTASAIRIIETQQRAIAELTEAIQHTVEYVGTDVLRPYPGWSWYDALTKHSPELLEAVLQLRPPQSVVDDTTTPEGSSS